MTKNSGNSQIAIRTLVGISALETVALAGFAIFLLVELIIATPDSLSSAIFLALIVGGFATALGYITRGLWRGNTAARSGSLVWQVLQGSLGLASGEGVFARYDIAMALGVPAIAGIVLILFVPAVRRHFD